jgi:hypothetical protein
MTVFFGERWNVPIVDHAQQAPTQSACLAISVNLPSVAVIKGFIRPLITEKGPGGNLRFTAAATWQPRSDTSSGSVAASKEAN